MIEQETTVDATLVYQLRKQTNAPVVECKKALIESNGDLNKASDILRQRGVILASRKIGRETSEGLVESYIHLGGKVGVLVEVNCETDFVAKTDDFKALCKDICLQIAAANPLAVSRDQISQELIDKEKEIAQAQAAGKNEFAAKKIVEGKLNKYFTEVCLLDQNFVKDPSKTIKQIVDEKIASLGENIVIRRFSRFRVNE